MEEASISSEKVAVTFVVGETLVAFAVGEVLRTEGGLVSVDGGGCASEHSTTVSGNSQPLIVSPFRVLFTMSMLNRSGLSARPESAAMIATLRELGGYATPAMVTAPKRLFCMVAFWASRTEMPPRTASGELPCTSLFSISASPASATSPTRSQRIPARPLLTTRLSCIQKPFRWSAESWQNWSHHNPLPWLSWM